MWLGDMLGIPSNILILCLLAGGVRVALDVEPYTVKGIMGIISSSVLLALIVHPLLTDEEYSKGLVTLLVALGSFAAKDIFNVIQQLFQQIKKDPLGLVREYLNWRHSKRPEDKE